MAHPTDIGQKTEAIILSELVKLDLKVLVPFGINHRYDLVVDTGDQFLRIQCKTGKLKDGVVAFNSKSVHAHRGKVDRPYTSEEIDVFAVYCPQNDCLYWVPIEDVEGMNRPFLRVEPAKNGQVKDIRWAYEYELQARVAQWKSTELVSQG